MPGRVPVLARVLQRLPVVRLVLHVVEQRQRVQRSVRRDPVRVTMPMPMPMPVTVTVEVRVVPVAVPVARVPMRVPVLVRPVTMTVRVRVRVCGDGGRQRQALVRATHRRQRGDPAHRRTRH
jgi:hypothetical protein